MKPLLALKGLAALVLFLALILALAEIVELILWGFAALVAVAATAGATFYALDKLTDLIL